MKQFALITCRSSFRAAKDYYPLVGHSSARYGEAVRKVNPDINVGRSIERRAFRRFALMLPALFRWADSVEHYDVGQCANVGLGGMFVFTSKCPPVGTQVEIEFVIPAFDLVPQELRLRCVGQVTRIETCYQVAGFALAGRIEGENQEEQLENMAVRLLTKQ